jgi:hypothetical protein
MHRKICHRRASCAAKLLNVDKEKRPWNGPNCSAISNLLEVERFKDYCPNGLQVEGRRRSGALFAG